MALALLVPFSLHTCIYLVACLSSRRNFQYGSRHQKLCMQYSFKGHVSSCWKAWLSSTDLCLTPLQAQAWP